MKLVFMGTPEFSVPALLALISGGHEVAAVVTQPDKRKGRGKEMQSTPVKEAALARGIPVFQPERIRDNEEFLKTLKTIRPDAIVVIAFGQLLPKEVLTLPPCGCINIHASLLPKYRGAAPIQWAIIDGEKETGITTMYMEEGLDTGDMLLKTVIPIEADETGGSLHDKLAKAGGPLILETLKGLEEGTLKRVPQAGETCYAKILTKDLGNVDWSMGAAAIERLIRGLSPWPGTYSRLNGKTVKLWRAEVCWKAPGVEETKAGEKPVPGTIIAVTKDGIFIQTGDGFLAVKELQLAGKKRMDAGAFLRGYPLQAGDKMEG
ncbi:MAG: methionyl-tRNA formyltransferase [Lachnospiraceae bacterium]|nr:methionyl-tRNA formyltransferase [Lachnospiraceae bacterium]